MASAGIRCWEVPRNCKGKTSFRQLEALLCAVPLTTCFVLASQGIASVLLIPCRHRRLDAENATREPEQHVRSQEFGSAFYLQSALDPPRRRGSRASLLPHLTSPPPQDACGKPTPTSRTELTLWLRQDEATPLPRLTDGERASFSPL